jgi:hypothetical protein
MISYILGLFTGAIIGITLMCILALSKEKEG